MALRGWLGVAVLALGLLLPAPLRAQPTGGAVIEIRDDGFSPSIVEIREGDTVVFRNRGTRPRWPASHIHPTHQIYPEFDARRPIGAGDEWTFRFGRTGEWRFHDHLAPEVGGTVVVSGRSGWPGRTAIRRAAVALERLARRAHDWVLVGAGRVYFWLFPHELEATVARMNVRRVAADDSLLRYWLSITGPERLMARLLRDSGGGSTFDCHQEAHQIGRVAYTLYGAVAFRTGDASCHSGFYHGAMEAFLSERGTANLAAEIEVLCGGFPTHFARFQCLHGVGHGVMAYEGYDLFRALDACGRLRGPLGQGACYEGVFMENIVSALGWGAHKGHRSPWVSRDPHFPCNHIPQEYAFQFHCYQMQTTWMLALFQLDFDRVSQECSRVRRDLVPVCYKSLGRDIASHTRRQPADIAAACARVRAVEDAYEQCVLGAVNVIVDFWGGELRDQASALCRVLTDSGKAACYAVVTRRLGEIFSRRSQWTQVCETFEPAYRQLCEQS